MKTIILPLIMVLLALHAGCATDLDKHALDEELSRLIIGTWENNKKGAKYKQRFLKNYLPGGIANGYYTEGYWSEGGNYIEEWGFTFESKWKIESGVMVIWDVQSNPAGVFSDGEVIRDKIIYINEGEAKFVSEETGKEFYRYRSQP